MRKALCLIVVSTACAVDPEADPDVEPAPDSFTVTSVELGPDGAKLLSRTEVTAADRDALGAGHKAQSDLPAGRETSALVGIDDSPCALASVFRYDRVNYGGNVLCIGGTGSMHLSQFVHHFDVQQDFFGTRIVPVGWQGRAASAWASFFSVDFFQDGSPEPVVRLTPGTGTNFINRPAGRASAPGNGQDVRTRPRARARRGRPGSRSSGERVAAARHLLRFVAQQIGPSPVLLLATARELETRASPELADALARIGREGRRSRSSGSGVTTSLHGWPTARPAPAPTRCTASPRGTRCSSRRCCGSAATASTSS